jgi:GT2 family glycosyltransferase
MHEDIAVVCGRLRERHPSSSVYNLLCDIEWEAPEGSVDACGGIAMMRASAFQSMNGFREDLIAGEEPELCVRLRKSAWRVWHLSDQMATHDAAMTRFGQWWRRSIRAGYAFAQGAHLHGGSSERHAMRESRSTWFWGLGIPMAVIACIPWFGGWSLLLLLSYPLQVARIAFRGRRSAHENWLYAVFLMIAKFAELLGQFKYLAHMAAGTRSRLIEYK